MNSTISIRMCRCCASEGTFKDVKTKYHWMGEEEVYSEILKDCFDIELYSMNDCENGGICEVCITQLRNASNFKKQVLHTEQQFKKIINNKSDFIKVEVANLDDLNNDVDEFSNRGLSDAEYEVPIKEESVEEPPKKKTPVAKPSTSRVKTAKTESATSKRKENSLCPSDPHSSGPMDSSEKALANANLRVRKLSEAVKHQQNLSNVLHYSNANLIKCKDNDGYLCSFCPKRYAKAMNLKMHCLDVHNDVSILQIPKPFEYQIKVDITELKCKLCKNDFYNLVKFTGHLKTDHDVVMYLDLKNQMVPFIFDDEIFRCAICRIEFTNFKVLQEHMHVHFRNFVCDICTAGFISKRLLSAHKRRHDNGKFKCCVCEKKFKCKQKLRLHEQHMHLGIKKRNKCTTCEEKFSDYWSKISHMVKMHGAEPPKFECQTCNHTFESKRALTVHVKRDHLIEKNWVCDICKKKFFYKQSLTIHVALHTTVKNVQCQVCSRRFTSKKFLKNHLKSHNTDKRLSCTVAIRDLLKKPIL